LVHISNPRRIEPLEEDANIPQTCVVLIKRELPLEDARRTLPEGKFLTEEEMATLDLDHLGDSPALAFAVVFTKTATGSYEKRRKLSRGVQVIVIPSTVVQCTLIVLV
jgi:hypothetical protein